MSKVLTMHIFSSTEDKTGNATFHIAIFEEAQDEKLRVVSSDLLNIECSK